MKIFMDTEFTGLHQGTTLISIGIVTEDGRQFYAELNDYDGSQVDNWIYNNVIKNLSYNTYRTQTLLPKTPASIANKYGMKGNKKQVAEALTAFLSPYETVQVWSDCLAYDWVLFCELFGGAMKLPSNIGYIPMDICTFMWYEGIDPDINREEFVTDYITDEPHNKHNALWDAKVIKWSYDKLMDM